MTDQPKLLPCPWCKSSARLLGGGQPFTDENGKDTTATAVSCNNDQCQATGPFLASAEQAQEAWNRTASLVAQAEAMARVCEAAPVILAARTETLNVEVEFDAVIKMREALADLERAWKGEG